MNLRCRSYWFAALGLMFFPALADSAVARGIIHVDDDAADGGDGLSWATAFNQLQRMAIEADPAYAEDRPYGGSKGLKAARSIALLSYRSEQIYNRTQKEENASVTSGLRASSYQNYQGEKLVQRFDAYSYHALTRLRDTHNVVR